MAGWHNFACTNGTRKKKKERKKRKKKGGETFTHAATAHE